MTYSVSSQITLSVIVSSKHFALPAWWLSSASCSFKETFYGVRKLRTSTFEKYHLMYQISRSHKVSTQKKQFISCDRPGEGSSEKNPCWWLTFRQPERKSSEQKSSLCRNVSHQQQFFSELPSPGRSHNTNYWYSWVQTIYTEETNSIKGYCYSDTSNVFNARWIFWQSANRRII